MKLRKSENLLISNKKALHNRHIISNSQEKSMSKLIKQTLLDRRKSHLKERANLVDYGQQRRLENRTKEEIQKDRGI